MVKDSRTTLLIDAGHLLPWPISAKVSLAEIQAEPKVEPVVTQSHMSFSTTLRETIDDQGAVSAWLLFRERYELELITASERYLAKWLCPSPGFHGEYVRDRTFDKVERVFETIETGKRPFDIENPRAWSRRVMWNFVILHMRKECCKMDTLENLTDNPHSRSVTCEAIKSPEEIMLRDEDDDFKAQCLLALDEVLDDDEWTMLILRAGLELSYNDIASRLGIEVAASRKKYQRILLKIGSFRNSMGKKLC